MPYFYTEAEVDVTVDDFIDSCNKQDIEDIIDRLKEDNYLGSKDFVDTDVSVIQSMFNDVLRKLQNSYYSLSNEDIQTIENIAKKY